MNMQAHPQTTYVPAVSPAWQYAQWLNSPYHNDKMVALREAYQNLPLAELLGFYVWVKHFWTQLDLTERNMAEQIRQRIIAEISQANMAGQNIQAPPGLLDPMYGNPYAFPTGLGGYVQQGMGGWLEDMQKQAASIASQGVNWLGQQATNAMNQSTTNPQSTPSAATPPTGQTGQQDPWAGVFNPDSLPSGGWDPNMPGASQTPPGGFPYEGAYGPGQTSAPTTQYGPQTTTTQPTQPTQTTQQTATQPAATTAVQPVQAKSWLEKNWFYILGGGALGYIGLRSLQMRERPS